MRVGEPLAGVLVAHRLQTLHEPDGGVHCQAPPRERLNFDARAARLEEAPEVLDAHSGRRSGVRPLCPAGGPHARCCPNRGGHRGGRNRCRERPPFASTSRDRPRRRTGARPPPPWRRGPRPRHLVRARDARHARPRAARPPAAGRHRGCRTRPNPAARGARALGRATPSPPVPPSPPPLPTPHRAAAAPHLCLRAHIKTHSLRDRQHKEHARGCAPKHHNAFQSRRWWCPWVNNTSTLISYFDDSPPSMRAVAHRNAPETTTTLFLQ